MKNKFLIGSLFLSVFALQANVRLNSLFSDNMVMQQGKPVPVWGWGDENEKVIVSFAGQRHEATTINGRWQVTLKPMKANTEGTEMVVQGNNEVRVKNILVGEVWICSGQSNMEWALFRTNGGEEAMAESTNDLLRICVVPHNVQEKPVENVNVKWVLANPKNTKFVSAVGYYFMSRLQREHKVPVGMLQIAFGGTVIESWISREVLEQMPNRDENMDPDRMRNKYNETIQRLQPVIQAYNQACDSARKLKQPLPERPREIPSEYKGATTIYNGEIAPIVPFAVKGIAWYQGESNAYVKRADTYYELLPAMIGLWRKAWNDPKLSFIIFQLTPNRKPQTDPNEFSGIAVISDAQAKTVEKTPYTALVTTMDCAEEDVHYREKRPVGDRAFFASQALAYGKPQIKYCGPLFKAMKINGNKCIISYTHAQNGLKTEGDSLKGFVIAGADRKFYFAEARIVANNVEVSSPHVSEPVAVRYGWADYPNVNLFNREGFPASPFRTDNWPYDK